MQEPATQPPPLEAASGALRQAQDQSELLLRSLQQNLTFDNVEESLQQGGGGVSGIDASAGGAAGDWSYAEEKHWHNVPTVMKRAVATLGRLLTRQTNMVLDTAAKADVTHTRVVRIEETMINVQKSIEALTKRYTEVAVKQDRTEVQRAALDERCDSDFAGLQASVNKCNDQIRQLHVKSQALDPLELQVDRLTIQLNEVIREEVPAVKARIETIHGYESNLKAVLSSVKDLQEQQIQQRYAAGGGMPLGGGRPITSVVGARGRSAGRWIWEGRRVLNSRSKLVQWDNRCHEQGESIRWHPDDKSYVIDLRRGGLYKINVGAVTTNATLSSDALVLYLDDDALLGSVQTTSFVAHSGGKGAALTGGGSHKVLGAASGRGGGGRHAVPNHSCSAADCSAACYTTIASSNYVFLPGRAFLCVRCTTDPQDVVCGWLEIEDFV